MSSPPRPVTADFLRECARKQAAYAARRRRYTDGDGDLALTEPEQPRTGGSVGSSPAALRPARRTPMRDPKQRTLALV